MQMRDIKKSGLERRGRGSGEVGGRGGGRSPYPYRPHFDPSLALACTWSDKKVTSFFATLYEADSLIRRIHTTHLPRV
jgi:hypothetical protein